MPRRPPAERRATDCTGKIRVVVLGYLIPGEPGSGRPWWVGVIVIGAVVVWVVLVIVYAWIKRR